MKYLITLLLLSTIAFSQTPQKPCTDERAAQFDFWVGEWELTWPGGQAGTPDDEIGKGRNHISKTLGGCTVEESFSTKDSSYMGRSWSVFNPQTEVWQQTWVDNSGGYLLFTGKYQNEKMELRTAVREQGDKKIVSRMVFENITPSGFDWNWQRSTDDGENWTDIWNIRYSRKK